MIGQTKLQATLDKYVDSGFPRFSIFYGPSGSGRKTLVRQLAKKLGATLVVADTKVDSIREVISLAYKQSEPTLYLIPEADKMSPSAKNALLKITEEPPRKAYFVMTILDLANTLDTLKSRGAVFAVDQYTPAEIMEYCDLQEYKLSEEEENIIQAVCLVPGQADKLIQYDVKAFYEFVETVADHIGTVSGPNAFKIGSKLAYKDDDEGYDITLFLRTLSIVYGAKMRQNPCHKYLECVKVISKYMSQLNTNGINKSATIDMLILELRGLEEE